MKRQTVLFPAFLCFVLGSAPFCSTLPLRALDLNETLEKAVDTTTEVAQEGKEVVAHQIAKLESALETDKSIGVAPVTSGVATVNDLKLNGEGSFLKVSPGQEVQVEMECFLDPKQCSSLELYHVVVGLAGHGAKACLCNYLGVLAGQTTERFVLKAPTQPGHYPIRFKVVHGCTEEEALTHWEDELGKEPDPLTTIGFLVVEEEAS